MTTVTSRIRIPIARAALLALAALFAAPAPAQLPGGATQPPPVIARVEGRPITQPDFERVAGPYIGQLRAQFGPSFTPELERTARRNVLDELIRRELLVVEFNRRGLPVSEAETDALLRQDPFFQTNGRFDESKFRQFKISPGSNYLQVLPRIREMAGASKVDSIVRAQLAPSNAQVRAEWQKLNESAQLSVLALSTREQSLEPEASEDEQRAYYAAHPDQFERPARLRLRYLQLPLPAPGDSARPAAEVETLARARALADSLRAGTPIDSLDGAGPVGPTDTGLLSMPAGSIPGIGSPPALLAAIARADSDTSVRVLGPVTIETGVFLGVIAERHPREVASLAEVRGDVKRRADLERRRADLDAEERAYYEAHRADFTAPHLALTRVTVAESAVRTRWPSPRDVERWYTRNGRALFGDSAGAALPPMSDSLRGVARERLMVEQRRVQAEAAARRLASQWRPEREPDDVARRAGAAVERVSIAGAAQADSLFPPAFLDSLFGMPEVTQVGKVQGPRRFFDHAVVWRVDTLDADRIKPFAEVQVQIQRDVLEERRKRDEAEAERFYEARRGDYKTKVKYVVDYVLVQIPPPDSIEIPEGDLREVYDARIGEFREPESVRARHILISTRGGDPTAEAAAKGRADSLRAAIEAGADFAELARTFSQDPGSAASGGDLGSFTRGRMVKAFEDTSFALAPGQVSQPVQTQFGWHLVKVEEHRPERVQALDEVRDRLRLELAQARGDSVARAAAERLRGRLARATAPDSVVAAPNGGLKTSPPFAPAEALPGVGVAGGLAEDMTPRSVGRWLAKVYRAGAGYLAIRPVKQVPPQPAEFAEVTAQVLEDWRNARRRELLDAKAAKVREGLAAGAGLDSLAGPLGGLRSVGPLFAGATFVPQIGPEPRLIEQAFKLDVGAVSDTIHTTNGVAWIRVDERKPRAGASFAAERDAVRQDLLAKRYIDWVERKRKTVKIEILRADLK